MPCTKNQVVPYRFSEDFSTRRYHKWGIGSPGRPFFFVMQVLCNLRKAKAKQD